MKRRLLFIFSILSLIGQNSFSQTTDFSQASNYLDALFAHDKYMGTVYLSSEGNPVYSYSVGYADRDTGQKLETSTKFNIGSISKMFTSVLIFKSLEEGKIKLDQALSDFYPEIPNAEKITIDQLLNHRSGIANFTDSPLYLTYFTTPKTEAELIQIISSGGSVFEPDSKAEYSNSNYILLTFILEKVNGKDFETLLEEKITKPLGLSNTRVFDEINPSEDEARSYEFRGGWILSPETDPSIPLGAGALQSNVEDLAKFIESLFAGKLISEESLQKMTEMKDGFGRGIFSFPYFEKRAFGHNGGIDGFQSLLGYFPDEKLTIVTLSNGMNWNANEVTLALLNTYFGKEVEIPSFETYDLDPAEIDQYLGVYTSEQIPLQFTFTKKNDALVVQATGQPEITLEPTAEHTFEFQQVGAVFIFNPEEKSLTFKQGGGTFQYKKQ
ncbi:class A beta-lactamase-related serine hydrolase [Algoriphagus kandeliae]|uniref:Class A beta-lactamase-related serine hydrolase n=1 Tax=Algoriphagus kandeliae TaxID=2562278 RepID=A0A4Y9QUX0_9BACT|nr:serine hydrolase domain-containing protein [Algoriphagus kandeliae]TFV95977.1 class A beta-lactamase-related serine hydrolase [Algoriphagus kandeliae]